ncbi:hypothetical protein HOLleu_09164 [Holothuria leucospilota]|uniref:Uncharacterized protein n=1 Tax=Holothuria leucospilota TaxID=206669 RepID=A0A9Q1CJE8_HOLLE|nr:hypothetical protein HOLleu_09164 [Holothuria leucospilota]
MSPGGKEMSPSGEEMSPGGEEMEEMSPGREEMSPGGEEKYWPTSSKSKVLWTTITLMTRPAIDGSNTEVIRNWFV